MDLVRDDLIWPASEDARAALVEFGLTTAFMTTVFSLVRWGIGTVTPAATAAEVRLRVIVVSVLVALVIVGFAVSRPGRFSGAHMNPAITLGLFAFGAVPARRVLPYLAAQATGSIAAAVVTRVLWGPAVAEEPIRWTVVQPGHGCSGSTVAVAEAATLAVIVAVMCWVKTRRPCWPLAWIVGGLFGLQGAVLGTLTGGSANPARQLGPAILSGESHLLVVYLFAPMAGGMLAGWIARHVGPGRRFGELSGTRPAVTHGERLGNFVAQHIVRPCRDIAGHADSGQASGTVGVTRRRPLRSWAEPAGDRSGRRRCRRVGVVRR
uniref:MIP/aquaporin family protein n=1 Tax=Paractinoplanes polyasparticus TaxID=2856853 RepID=UPI001C858ACA|nr:aquaporin [Actinoplanes polyasparticus]